MTTTPFVHGAIDDAQRPPGHGPATPHTGWYLAIDGDGAPDGEPFARRADVLRLAARMLRDTLRRRGVRHPLARLEAQAWGADPAAPPPDDAGERGRWRLLLRVPDDVTLADLEATGERLRRLQRRRPLLAAVRLVARDARRDRIVRPLGGTPRAA